MSNLYVSLEEQKNSLNKLRDKVITRWWPNDTDMTRLAEISLFVEIFSIIDSLPTINLSVIDEMIDEIKHGIDPWHVTMLSARATLEELKQRLLNNK